MLNTSSTVKKLRTLLIAMKDGTLQPQPPFQRRLVWTSKDRTFFLESVLAGYPFPEIYTAAGDVNLDTGEGREQLVDGQQRMTTLYQFFVGDPNLKVASSLPTYSQLSEDQKARFLDYQVVVRDLGFLSYDDITDVFQRINSTSYALNAMEIHNARYAGEFKQFGEEIANLSFFDSHNVFSPNDVRRMSDVRFALTLIVSVMSTYFHRDDLLEEYLSEYNEQFDAKGDIRRELDEVFLFVEESNIPRRSRAWKTSDLLTLLVELHRMLIRESLELSPKEIGVRLNNFFYSIDNRDQVTEGTDTRDLLETYFRAAVQATNDRANRFRRADIITKAIHGQLPQLLEYSC